MDARDEARKVVFDTGVNKEALVHNLKLLEADLSDVNCIVISHGHGDHSAATVEVVEAAGGTKVYGHPHTFLPQIYVDMVRSVIAGVHQRERVRPTSRRPAESCSYPRSPPRWCRGSGPRGRWRG